MQAVLCLVPKKRAIYFASNGSHFIFPDPKMLIAYSGRYHYCPRLTQRNQNPRCVTNGMVSSYRHFPPYLSSRASSPNHHICSLSFGKGGKSGIKRSASLAGILSTGSGRGTRVKNQCWAEKESQAPRDVAGEMFLSVREERRDV